MIVAAQIAPHHTNSPTTKSKIQRSAHKLQTNPKPAARESLLTNAHCQIAGASHARRSGLIRPETTAQYSDARWVIQALQERLTHRSNSRFMLLFPEPTKNQRPRSTARFLVES